MEQNEGAQEAVVEQEVTTEETTEEAVEESHDEGEVAEKPKTAEDTVILKKSDFNKLNRKAIAYEAEKKKPIEVRATLEVDDFIDISAALEGLDQREKEYLAQQHKYTGKSLSELRKDENFSLWQSAYRAKTEKEKAALAPSSTQADTDRPKTLAEKLANATLAEKEEILAQAGLWKSPRTQAERKNIGR